MDYQSAEVSISTISKSILPFSDISSFLNPQGRINKMVNKHSVNYHPSPSQLISRICPLMFLWAPKMFISPQPFLNFFLNLYIPPCLQKSFKFIVLTLLTNTFVSPKIESIHFIHAHNQNSLSGLCHHPLGIRKLPIPPKQRFLKMFFPQQREWGRGLWS